MLHLSVDSPEEIVARRPASALYWRTCEGWLLGRRDSFGESASVEVLYVPVGGNLSTVDVCRCDRPERANDYSVEHIRTRRRLE